MKICFLGKYPPIEGGVSASTYWLAHGLAERGHTVSVVTNADEVETEYRMHLGPGDEELYAPAFPASGGSVEVLATERLGPRMTHIPRHNPFATKLAGLATQTIRSRGCEVIFAYYFEPYAIAAFLASAWTGVPWVARHAGSDLDRLMAIPELGTAYKEALRAADGILVTKAHMAERFRGIGVPGERLFRTEPYSPPRSFFHPDGEPLDVDALPEVLAPRAAGGGPAAFDRSVPTIGIYGKIGVTKGSFDLLHALAMLRREGLSFQFLALTQGRAFPRFARAVRDLGLDDRTWVVPFLPNWRVPSFIRTCTAVCFLERDFPVKIHSPVVASEIFATGGCLVVSGEIAGKQRSRDAMVDGETVLLVDDPKDHDQLAARLRQVIEDPREARRIGRRGAALADEPEAFDRYVESYERILTRAAGGDSDVRTFAAPERDDASVESDHPDAAADRLMRRMPWLAAVLPDQAPRLVADFYQSDGASDAGDVVGAGLAFCEFLRRRLDAGRLPERQKDLLEACLLFQVRRWQTQRDDPQVRGTMAFEAADKLCGARVSSDRALPLRPLRSRHAEVVELDYDVVPLFTGAAPAEPPGPDAENRAVNGFEIEKSPTIVCFLRAANLRRTEIELTSSARDLLDLCDGSRSTGQILDLLAERRRLAPDPPNEPDGLREQVVAALQQLYDRRVVVFCDRPPRQPAP